MPKTTAPLKTRKHNQVQSKLLLALLALLSVSIISGIGFEGFSQLLVALFGTAIKKSKQQKYRAQLPISSSTLSLSSLEPSFTHSRQLLTTPIGLDQQLNIYTPDWQNYARPTALPDGNFLAAWESYGQPTGLATEDNIYQGNIWAVILDPDNNPIGIPFLLNKKVQYKQARVAVTSLPPGSFLPSGGFAAAWHTERQEPGDGADDYAIAYRIFHNDGAPATDEAFANTFPDDRQRYPDIKAEPNGNIVISWHSKNQDLSGFAVVANIFSPTGNATRDEFIVPRSITGNQEYPRTGTYPSNEFTITWSGEEQDEFGIFSLRHNSTGHRIYNETSVPTYIDGNQERSDIATQDDGSSLIAWHTEHSLSDNHDIAYKILDQQNNPITVEKTANSYTPGDQMHVSTTHGPNNTYFLSWHSQNQAILGQTDDTACYIRQIDQYGEARSVEFRYSPDTGTHSFCRIAYSPVTNRILAVWQRFYSNTGYEIFSQVLDAAPEFTLIKNKLTAINGQPILVTTEVFDVSGTAPDSLIILIENLSGGQFELVSQPEIEITQLTLGQVRTEAVQFVHAGDMEVVHFETRVTNGAITSLASTAITSVEEYVPPPPVITPPELIASYTSMETEAGESTERDIARSWKDPETLQFSMSAVPAWPEGVIFSNLTNLFQITPDAKKVEVTTFIVTAAKLLNLSLTATGSFDLTINPASSPSRDENDFTNIIIGGCISGGIAFAFLIARMVFKCLAERGLEKICREKPDTLYQTKVILPILRYIRNHINFSSIIGRTSDGENEKLLDAVDKAIKGTNKHIALLIKKYKSEQQPYHEINLELATERIYAEQWSRVIKVITSKTYEQLFPDRVDYGKESTCSSITLQRWLTKEASAFTFYDRATQIGIESAKELWSELIVKPTSSHALVKIESPTYSQQALTGRAAFFGEHKQLEDSSPHSSNLISSPSRTISAPSDRSSEGSVFPIPPHAISLAKLDRQRRDSFGPKDMPLSPSQQQQFSDLEMGELAEGNGKKPLDTFEGESEGDSRISTLSS